jgi:hypothetical protein
MHCRAARSGPPILAGVALKMSCRARHWTSCATRSSARCRQAFRSPPQLWFLRHHLRGQVRHNAKALQYRLCCNAFSAANRAAYAAGRNLGLGLATALDPVRDLVKDLLKVPNRSMAKHSRPRGAPALPLPAGERVGVRGVGRRRQTAVSEPPHPSALRAADLSPPGRGENEFRSRDACASELCQRHSQIVPRSRIASRLSRRWDRVSARSCPTNKRKRNAGRRISRSSAPYGRGSRSAERARLSAFHHGSRPRDSRIPKAQLQARLPATRRR